MSTTIKQSLENNWHLLVFKPIPKEKSKHKT